MILIYLLVQVYGAIITYDTNTLSDFDYMVVGTFNCASKSYTSTVTFSGTFANIPKVILNIETLDSATTPNFELSITSTTTTGFTLLINCPTSRRAYRVLLKWYAIDDSHIEIVNAFNIASPTLTKTFSHSNPNALYGYVSIISLKASGSINFQLSISELTSTSVTTTLTSNTNLGQIGYQIILGAYGVFDFETTKSSTASYTSPTFSVKTNKVLLTPFQGFTYPNTYNIKLAKTNTITSTDSSYAIANWADSYTSNVITPTWIPYKLIDASEAYRIEHMNIRNYEDFGTDSRQSIEMEISQLGLSYKSVGTQTKYIEKTSQILNINLYVKCQAGKKISSKFNYCGQCANQYPYQQVRYCPGTVNALKYFTRFKTTVAAIKQLTFTVTSSSVSVTQLAYIGSGATEFSLISIQFINI